MFSRRHFDANARIRNDIYTASVYRVKNAAGGVNTYRTINNNNNNNTLITGLNFSSIINVVLAGAVCVNDGYPAPISRFRSDWLTESPARPAPALDYCTSPFLYNIIRSFGHKNHSSFVRRLRARQTYCVYLYNILLLYKIIIAITVYVSKTLKQYVYTNNTITNIPAGSYKDN